MAARESGYERTPESNTPQSRTLYRALEILGGVAPLAKALKVPVETLARWLDGNAIPPVGAYLIALVRPAAAGDVGAAHRVDPAADLGDREAVPRRGHRRQPLPAVALRVVGLVRAEGPHQVVQVGLAAEHVHAALQHRHADPAARGRHAEHRGPGVLRHVV